MFSNGKQYAALAVPLLLGLGLAGLSAGAGASPSGAGPLHCQINQTKSGGMVTLQGVVRSDVAATGTYRFRVVGRGSSGGANINQSGDFFVDPVSEAYLGQVSLGGSGIYDASLEVTANGLRATCTGHDSAT